MTEKAIEKLDKEFAECGKLSAKGKAVSSAVLDALKSFCGQNTEFAQAVVQTDKSIKDCIESTVKDCGSSVSDIDVYRKAVQFYFAGADVHFEMTLDLGDGGFSNDKGNQSGLRLSLDDLLDF